MNRTKCLLCRDGEKNNLLAIAGTMSICWGSRCLPSLRGDHPQVKQTRIIHGHSRLYRGRYRSLSIRFRAISHGARLGKGNAEGCNSFRCVRNFWIHGAFFFFLTRGVSFSASCAATKGHRWKNVIDAEGERIGIAYNHREV